jgi:DNA invertase Pin-like site-specific DNA recombinase
VGMPSQSSPLAYGYCRRQAGNSLGLEEQKAIEQHFTASLKATHAWGGLFTDDVSSGKKRLRLRPAGSDLFARLERGDCVIFASLLSGFRTALDLEESLHILQARGVRVIFLELLGLSITQLLIRLAQFERARNSEHVAAAHVAMRGEGRPLGRFPPYGFTFVGRGKARRLKPCQRERDIGRMIVRWRQDGFSWDQIVSYLMSNRIKTKTGGDYHKSVVQRHYAAELELSAREQQAQGGAGA